MCACRYGIPVYLKDGKVRYIEGNRDHPVTTVCVTARTKIGSAELGASAKLLMFDC